MAAEFVTPVTVDHLRLLDRDLREGDRAEVVAVGRPDIVRQLSRDVLLSAESYAVFQDGDLLGVTGVRPMSLISNTARPWLLTTRHVERHKRTLLRGTRMLLRRWRKRWRALSNEIHADYQGALRWAEWSGATLGEPYEIAPGVRFVTATWPGIGED